MGLQAALFDLDGTLIDSIPGIEFSVDSAISELGLPVRESDLRPLIGPPIREIFGHLLPQLGEQQLWNLEAAFRVSYDSSGWQKTVLYENVALILEKLSRAGVRLFVVTNKPTFATGRILEALGISHFFETVLCRDGRMPYFTSKSEMLKDLMHASNLQSDNCLYIGDTYDDYQAGMESGVQVVIVRHDGICDHRGYPGCSIIKNLIELMPNNIELKETA
jgi:phosphoglycolate phosphatase